MTPERAAELAYGVFPLAAIPDSELEYMAEALKHAILAACKEQRELDARIALKSNSSAGYDIAQAIRGAE